MEAAGPNQIWQSDMTKIWAGPAMGWAYLVCVIDCCTREIVGWNLSHRCRAEDALAAIEQAVLARLPDGSREANVTLTTDNGTQFTSFSGLAFGIFETIVLLSEISPAFMLAGHEC